MKIEVNPLEDGLQYNVLTKKSEYYKGPTLYDDLMEEEYDTFRIGFNGDDEFCIEDSIGRFIPFRLDQIDALIDILSFFREDNEKAIKIAKLEEEIRDLKYGN